MAEIHVERRHAGSWVPWAALVVLVVGGLGIYRAGGWAPAEKAGLYDPYRHASLSVPYQGANYKPMGPTLAVSDADMRLVGSQQRVGIFAPVGGGGAKGHEQLFVKVGPNRYVALIRHE